MASSGKKGKKSKGTVISLQSFLSNGDTPAGTTQVAKKIRNVDGDESDDGSHSMPLVYQLPTAPRASRVFDDDSIPHKPPYICYITNLPFDANEDDIYGFFESMSVVSLRLPREEGETGRVRGFGYVEFETRDDLIHVLSLPDPAIKGRRIRIELSTENEQQNNRQRGSRRGFDNFGYGGSGEDRDTTNWRRDTQVHEPAGYGNYKERGFNRDRKSDDQMTPGSWRTSGRPVTSDSSPRRDRFSGRQRDNSSRNKNFERDEWEKTTEEEAVTERPKLNLKPRTLPLPEIIKKEVAISEKSNDIKNESVKHSGVAPEKVFGSAKPVDTAARELEIEERLAETRRQDKLRREQEKAEVNEKLAEIHLEKTDKENANSTISWRRKNDPTTDDEKKQSPDRSGLNRSDDRGLNNRDRDYNRFNKNRVKNDRTELARRPVNQIRDGKQKEDNKIKRDSKTERALPKYQSNQSGPVLQSSNKYSGLDDEASE